MVSDITVYTDMWQWVDNTGSYAAAIHVHKGTYTYC